jgi:hypothetical protein
MQIRALCTTGDIHDNNLQGGGGRNSKIVKILCAKHQIWIFETKQRMNVVGALYYEVKHAS